MKNENKCRMSRQRVREFDAWAISEMGIPSVVLMENAGKNCASVIIDMLERISTDNVTIIAGTGNNGGDGFVIARHLYNASVKVRVVVLGDIDRIAGDARTNLVILEKMDIPVISIDLDESVCRRIKELTSDSGLLVDAIFGTGLSGACREPYPVIIQCINGLGIPVAAVDIPSGLDCDLGVPTDGVNAIKAQLTVTFVAMKEGFVVGCASEYTGKVLTASIGIKPTSHWYSM